MQTQHNLCHSLISSVTLETLLNISVYFLFMYKNTNLIDSHTKKDNSDEVLMPD